MQTNRQQPSNRKTSPPEDIFRAFCLLIYYILLRWLPDSTCPYGRIWRYLRRWACIPLFLYCGKNVNIERGAYFGTGGTISVGQNSGIGINSRIGRGTTIGSNVMMGRDVIILSRNHKTSRLDIPMMKQGFEKYAPVTIGDDVWIGDRVIILPGVSVKDGSIIGAGSIVTKNVPLYAVIAGNPARIIRYRHK